MKSFFQNHSTSRLRRVFKHRSLFFVGLMVFTTAQQPAIQSASAWLISQQQDKGGWQDGFTERAGGGITAEAVIALWAADVEVKTLDPSPLEALKNFANQNATTLTPALAAKLTFAALIFESDVTSFSGVNLIEVMLAQSSPEGMIGGSTFESCFSLIALHAAHQDLPAPSISFIQTQANPDGGWGFAPADSSDTNTTAVCLQALIAADSADDVLPAALTYLRDQQNADGGWAFQKPSDFSTESETYSTALVIMTLNAAHENLEEWHDPISLLESFQAADGGFSYSHALPDQNRLWATVQALPALAGKSWLDIGQ